MGGGAQLLRASITSLFPTISLQTEDLKEIAIKLAAHTKANEKRSRQVIITQGEKPTLVAQGMYM